MEGDRPRTGRTANPRRYDEGLAHAHCSAVHPGGRRPVGVASPDGWWKPGRSKTALARRTHEREHNHCGASTHGLRAIEDDRPRVYRGEASTLLHEAGFPTQIIERQLVHVEPDEVKAAYNPAERLPHATQNDAGGGRPSRCLATGKNRALWSARPELVSTRRPSNNEG